MMVRTMSATQVRKYVEMGRTCGAKSAPCPPCASAACASWDIISPLSRSGEGRQVARLHLAPGSPFSSPPLARSSSSNQVEEGEEIDPDEVDEVPVEADALDGGVVAARELTPERAHQDPADEPHADDDVDAVDAGHHEVAGEEDARVLAGLEALGGEGGAGEETVDELVVVLEVLDDEEGRGEGERQRQHQRRQALLRLLRRAHAERHRQGRADEDDGVGAAHHLVEVVVRLPEGLEVPAPEDRERAEHPAEEEDLRDEEDPDSHAAGIELRLRAVEVMRDVELRRQRHRALAALGMRLRAHSVLTLVRSS